ncbi:MAG: CCA tRNA nucleotidyltransferase [Chloroflexi bacterium]|nr:CCA tRNA nucleotidyltransferase [Chloroflexota bacterium]
MDRELDLKAHMEQHLPRRALELISNATQVAECAGQNLYLVGGVVRDLILHRTCIDIDLVLEGHAIDFARGLSSSAEKLVTHTRFCTATLKGDGFSLDFTTARKEEYPNPGALPVVSPSNIHDDLFRRDFTINAMAIALTGQRRGQIIDPWQGLDDLCKGLLRVLHGRSFVDDATRMLRAIRYEQRLGFRLEENTERLIYQDIAFLDTISGDRLRHELERIFAEEFPERALRRAQELGILAQIHKALRGGGWVAEAFHRAREMGRPPTSQMCYALLLYYANEHEAEQALARLNVSAEARKVTFDSLRLRKELETLSVPEIRHSRIYSLLKAYDPQAIAVNLIVCFDAVAQGRLALFLEKLNDTTPVLRGDDLLALGVPPGPKVGEFLQALLKAKLDGEATTKEDELVLVRRWLTA